MSASIAQIGGYHASVLSRLSQHVTVIAVTGLSVMRDCAGHGDRRRRFGQGGESDGSGHQASSVAETCSRSAAATAPDNKVAYKAVKRRGPGTAWDREPRRAAVLARRNEQLCPALPAVTVVAGGDGVGLDGAGKLSCVAGVESVRQYCFGSHQGRRGLEIAGSAVQQRGRQ